MSGVRCSILVVLITFLFDKAHAQNDTLPVLSRNATTYSVEAVGLMATGSRTPFWLRANRYGIVPINSPAGLVIAGTSGHFSLSERRPSRQLSYGLEVAGSAARRSTVLVPQAFLSLNLGKVVLWAGRKKEVIGLGDSTLTSGFYAWSGNALPITKVQIGTNGFVPLAFTKGLISVNAFFAHGWFPSTDLIQGSYLHQKAVYGRLGKPNWPVKLYGGLLHNAQWGGRSDYLSKTLAVNGRLPSSFTDYLSVIVAKQPDQEGKYAEIDKVNQIGNHLGSIDLGAEWETARWHVLSYYQHPFEDKSGLKFVNFPDGLYGVRFKRKPVTASPWIRIDQFVVEYLSTMDQSGLTLGPRLQGIDDYFNNFQYRNGWISQHQVIGTPFLSPRDEVQPSLQNAGSGLSRYQLAIINNRVQLLHIGLTALFQSGVHLQTKLSYSANHGTIRIPFEPSVGQFSGAAWLTWPLHWFGGSQLQTAVALDQGQLYDNTLGGWISLKKTFTTVR